MNRRRNRRKYRSGQQGFTFALPMAVPLGLIVAAALFYLWVDNRCEAQGFRIQRLESQLRDAESRRLNEEFKMQTLRSPANLERALQKHGLRMEWPNQDRVVQLIHDPDFAKLSADMDERPAPVRLVRRD